MESIVRDAIVSHTANNGLFVDEQHGFVPMRSCSTQLLLALESWCDILDNGGLVDVIYTDFAKAFDTVPHERLAVKMEAFGITGKILRWVKSFLHNRRQKVCIEGVESKWGAVKSGIPQGSVLGPTLFVLFINDMPEEVTNMCKLFADDAKISSDITSSNSSLQDDLNNLTKWADRWNLPLNTSKCKCLHIGKSNPRMQYTMNGHLLENVNFNKDLGVIMDSELKFHIQTSSAIKKANKILGLIKKTFANLDANTLPLLYKSMVRRPLRIWKYCMGPTF